MIRIIFKELNFLNQIFNTNIRIKIIEKYKKIFYKK
jgi:hypothetical protein